MKIIITGGLGYVGGRLSKYLAEQGHTVIALSRQANALTGITLPKDLSVENPDIYFQQPENLKEFDAFIHLAAMNENDCVKFPEKAIDVNFTQTWQWLDSAYRAGIERFIYFSTAHVYGKPLQGYYDEQSLTRPVHPYAITHKSAEDYVLAYAAEKGMKNLVIRLSNAFGGPAFPTADRWTLLVNDLCRSAVSSGKMTLLSDGSQLRDFVCLEDVCSATAHLIGRNFGNKNLIYNLSCGESLSVLNMAIIIKKNAEEFLGHPVELNRKELESNSEVSLVISNQNLLSTGFTLNGAIDLEIKSTLKYFMDTMIVKY